jgi:hypothetical protein
MLMVVLFDGENVSLVGYRPMFPKSIVISATQGELVQMRIEFDVA